MSTLPERSKRDFQMAARPMLLLVVLYVVGKDERHSAARQLRVDEGEHYRKLPPCTFGAGRKSFAVRAARLRKQSTASATT